jgi:hypothetical protein
MPNFKIFTDSKADIKFLQDYVEEIFQIYLQHEDFDSIGGRTGYKAGGELKASFRKNLDNNKESILIVDADTNFKESKKEILADFEKYNIPIHLFQFPNDAANGNLEDLLAAIAVDKKLMVCFQDYEKCVNAYPKKLNDSRIYSYLDMLLIDNYKDEKGKDLRREEFRNYRNINHWNLHHEFLNPLKEFLTPFFAK